MSADLSTDVRQALAVRAALTKQQQDKSVVQVQVHARPFCIRLVEDDGAIVVTGFTPDPQATSRKGAIESSGLVQIGDNLISVNDFRLETGASMDDTVQVLMAAELPASLTFRRVAVTKATLGEYTVEDIAQYLAEHGNPLSSAHGVQEAAALVKACIDVRDEAAATTPLMMYVHRLVPTFCAPMESMTNETKMRKRYDEMVKLIENAHRYVDICAKDHVKQWNAMKSSNFKRLDILTKQRGSIEKRLDQMRANTAQPLVPENHEVWKEYIELRHLSNQMHESLEKSKQEHYLPEFEGYTLRFGSDGVYIGVSDVWIPSFHSQFTVETRSTAPHVCLQLSTPSAHGLKVRIKNFKLATEGPLPSFHCDELNIEAQLVADIPLHFDSIQGWKVPPDDLHVQLTSFHYYERHANSAKKSKEHDTMIKLFINRLMPLVVRHAAQQILCVELGPLLESRGAQAVLSGEISIQGRSLALYDMMLSSSTKQTNAKDQELAEEARSMIAISDEEADLIFTLLKSLDKRNTKMLTFGAAEPPDLSLRGLISYFDQFKNDLHVKALVCELWQQSLDVLALLSDSFSDNDYSSAAALSVPLMVQHLEQLDSFPVNVSVSLLEVTFRLDLVSGADTLYAVLQRIIRRKMDSISVGIDNLDALRDGTYLEKELATLDERYALIKNLMSYVTGNIEEMGVVIRGGMPAGFMSKLFIETRNLACKGPVKGSVTIPLTDLASLSSQSIDIKPKEPENTPPSATALTHEHEALVLSKFFLHHLNQLHDADFLEDEDGNDHKPASAGLPRDRLRFSVTNTSARVLFEVPTDLSVLEPGTVLSPFAFSIVTSSSEGPPRIQFETGPFAKCQYTAERIAMSGSVWQFLKRATEEPAEQGNDNVAASDSAQTKPSDSETTQQQEGGLRAEYLDSPSFSLKFHFFTSCQVTQDHIHWSISSASLTEPKIAQLKHRISLVQLLQDLGSMQVMDVGAETAGSASSRKQRESARRFRRVLYQQQHKLATPLSVRSNMSERETLFSRASATGTLEDEDEYDIDDRMSLSTRSRDAATANDDLSSFLKDTQNDDEVLHSVQEDNETAPLPEDAEQRGEDDEEIQSDSDEENADIVDAPAPMQRRPSVFF